MNPIDKLKAKANRTRKETPTTRSKPMNKGIQTILQGKATGEHLNEKELAIMQWLLEEAPDGTGHLKDFREIMIHKFSVDGVYDNEESTSKGEEKAYRHAQNSTRKLVAIEAVDRVAPGTYSVFPNRGRRLVRETLEWMEQRAEDESPSVRNYTPQEVHEHLIVHPDTPTKAAVARAVGIKARRWGSLLNGSVVRDDEQELLNKAMQ